MQHGFVYFLFTAITPSHLLSAVPIFPTILRLAGMIALCETNSNENITYMVIPGSDAG